MWATSGSFSVLHTQQSTYLRTAKKGAEAGTKTKPELHSSQGTRRMWLMLMLSRRLLCALELRDGPHLNLQQRLVPRASALTPFTVRIRPAGNWRRTVSRVRLFFQLWLPGLTSGRHGRSFKPPSARTLCAAPAWESKPASCQECDYECFRALGRASDVRLDWPSLWATPKSVTL